MGTVRLFVVIAIVASGALGSCSPAAPEWATRDSDAGRVATPPATPAVSPRPAAPTPDPPPAAQAPENAPPQAPTKNLYLQPLGRQLSPEAVEIVETALVEFYGFQIKRAEPVPLPRFAFYEPRKRYRAEKLLDFLNQRAPSDAFRILGVTASDISTTAHGYRDWGIMGYASMDGRVSVMSMFRCRRGSRSPLHARERLAKVAVHEVGHTLGLEHCPTRGCLMEDARGTNTTTDREHLMCPRCRRFLAGRGYNLPPDPTPPWRAPTG